MNRIIVAVALCTGGVSHADGLFPSIPSLKSIDVGFGSERVIGGKGWSDADAINSVKVEVGLTLWREHIERYKIDPKTRVLVTDKAGVVQTETVEGNGAVVMYAGTSFGSTSGDLTSSLRGNASLRDNYFGANYTYQWSPYLGVFIGGDVRFVSFDSGRAYENDPNRTAFKLSGSGYGGEFHAGLGILKYGFVGASVIGRSFPSIIVDPPSGVSLPSTVPASIRFGSVGVMAGVQFVFDATERPINAFN